MRTPRACVVIPAYNAANTLGALVGQIRAQGLDAIVVDDGSTDGTAKISTESGALVISHVHNQGKGSAVRSGFGFALESGYDVIVTMDSDGQHDPQDIPNLLEVMKRPGTDIVVGQRVMSRGPMPLERQWVNQVMSSIVSWIARQRIPDSQCGFRAVRREVLSTLQLSTSHFEVETELLLAAAKRGWTIVSVPIRTIYNGHKSHIRPLIDGLRFTSLVVRYLTIKQAPKRRA